MFTYFLLVQIRATCRPLISIRVPANTPDCQLRKTEQELIRQISTVIDPSQVIDFSQTLDPRPNQPDGVTYLLPGGQDTAFTLRVSTLHEYAKSCKAGSKIETACFKYRSQK